IGDTGEPKWSNWLSGGRAARTGRATDGAFLVHSTSDSFLQLVRDPRRRHYRLRAQVRHDESRDAGAVGIFFCAQRPGPPGEAFACLLLYFNDWQSVAPPWEKLTPEARAAILKFQRGNQANQPLLNPVSL